MTNLTRSLLLRHGLRANKARGQNFLVDERPCARIVDAASLGADDWVVEIGAGLGALTIGLAARARRVIAIENDRALADALAGALAEQHIDNVEIVRQDALRFAFADLALVAGRPLVVVGNLPYNITSPLLFGVLDGADRGRVIDRAVVMVQKEFADRMVSTPGGKIYGRLSVMAQQQADIAELFHVPAGAFLPQPRVKSTVVGLRPRSAPRAGVGDARMFATVVRAAFSTRRKMVRNALEGTFTDREAVAGALSDAGVAGEKRAEVLAIEDFARIADALSARGVRVAEISGAADAGDQAAGRAGTDA